MSKKKIDELTLGDIRGPLDSAELASQFESYYEYRERQPLDEQIELFVEDIREQDDETALDAVGDLLENHIGTRASLEAGYQPHLASNPDSRRFVCEFLKRIGR